MEACPVIYDYKLLNIFFEKDMNMTKKIILIFSMFIMFATFAVAQQITRFAVVDTTVVYQTYFRESAAVRNYESMKAEFQTEIVRLTDELKALQVKKIEAQKENDNAKVQRLEGEITQKASYLTEYTRAKNIKLDDMKKRLESSDDFYELMYNTIARIAESDGYSMVLSLQQADAVLWYSTSVDITEKVIQEISAQR